MAEDIKDPARGSTGQAPGASQDAGTGQAPTSQPQAGSLSPGDLERELKEARQEAAKYRTQLRDLENKLKEYEDKDLSEKEKLTKKAQELEAKLQKAENDRQLAILSAEVKLKAQAKGIVDPDAALKLIDLSEVKIEDGKIEGLEQALEKLVKEKPYLLSTSGKPNPTNPARTSSVSFEELKKLTPAEINARWEELKNVKKS